MIATGTSLEQALELAVEVETLAEMYWRALQVGEPRSLDEREMREVLEKFATYESVVDTVRHSRSGAAK
jgi:L-fuculose-phosphate aldolase